MVWVRVAFHEKDGNHENDEDNSDSYKQGVECWSRGNHGNHENDENHENPGCKPRVPQTTGLEIPGKKLQKSSGPLRCGAPKPNLNKLNHPHVPSGPFLCKIVSRQFLPRDIKLSLLAHWVHIREKSLSTIDFEVDTHTGSGRIKHAPNCGYRFVSPLPPFSRRGICRFPVPENALFLWEVLLFLQNFLYESTVFPHR